MNLKSNSKTSLFLMELIIAIFFFSLAAAISVKLFVSAHVLAEKTINLNNALTWSENLSEAFTGNSGEIDKIGALYPSAFVAGDSLILFFDDDWKIISGELSGASYEAVLFTKTVSASEAYSDVTEYDIPLKGGAIVGNITIIDVRDLEDNITDMEYLEPSRIIFENSVDYYLGEEAKGE